MRVADVKPGQRFRYSVSEYIMGGNWRHDVKYADGSPSGGFGCPDTQVELVTPVEQLAEAPALNVCQEADQIAGQGGDRMRDYGHPLDNHKRIADGWTILLGHPVTPSQAALCMMWLKLAREMNTYKRDNMVDLCGYAKCYEMIKDEEKRRMEVKP